MNKYLWLIKEPFEVHYQTLFAELAQMYFDPDKGFIYPFGYCSISLCSTIQSLEPPSVSTVNDQKC